MCSAGRWHVNFKIICTWLAFEVVCAFINLTTKLPIRDLISGIQLTASDQTVRELATLLIAESTSLAKTYFQAWYINESKGQHLPNRINQDIYVLNSVREVRHQSDTSFSLNCFYFKLALVLRRTGTLSYR